MAAFQWSDDGRHAILLEPYRRWTRYGVVTVPAGFVTDFASIPRIFWRMVPPIGRYNHAAIIHDYLYRTPSKIWTRAKADRVFHDLMVEDGVSSARANTMYWAVRIGARFAWQREAKGKTQ